MVKQNKDGISWKLVKKKSGDKTLKQVYVYYDDGDKNKLITTIPYERYPDKRDKRGYTDNLDYSRLKKNKKIKDFERKYKNTNKLNKRALTREVKNPVNKKKFYTSYTTKIRFYACAFDSNNNSKQFIDLKNGAKFKKVRMYKTYTQMLNMILTERDKMLINEYLNDERYLVNGGIHYAVYGLNGDTGKYETINEKHYKFHKNN